MKPIRRAPFALAAAGLLLAGCSSTVEGTASPSPTGEGGSSSSSSSSSAPSSSGGSSGSGDLSAGLLPEDAFGAGATVAPVTEADVAAGSAAGSLDGATVTPEACAAAVQKSQPSVEDLDGFAAQAATTGTTGTTITVQVITEGAPGDPAADLASAVQSCPQATVTSPEIGTATITFAVLDVPDIGDGSAALSYTTTVTGPDGTQLAIPAQVGVVRDGDRAVTLLSTTVGGTLDPASFAALLQQAYDYQAEQLD
ncbi:hypothetical protein SAMN03159343_3548 [Klenkia marina]|uniref:PknH-like extracellular domain-containing protein n=1 Tax=Klenkia marina TaxID=1960309 RepID=A0A1G4YU34_9ACTN|nr:hypothetical protein [Klenkia marina]SCX56967.1 hypothetical protein SAMN03159343_3548 [Klenkia marina]